MKYLIKVHVKHHMLVQVELDTGTIFWELQRVSDALVDNPAIPGVVMVNEWWRGNFIDNSKLLKLLLVMLEPLAWCTLFGVGHRSWYIHHLLTFLWRGGIDRIGERHYVEWSQLIVKCCQPVEISMSTSWDIQDYMSGAWNKKKNYE